MRVHLTQADIDSARRPNGPCPLERALRREGHRGVWVTPMSYRADGGAYRLSEQGREIARRFDYAEPLEPQVVDLGDEPWPYA